MKRALFGLLLALALLAPTGLVLAQEEPEEGPVYIVQQGDTLWEISQRFGVDLFALMTANDLTDASQLTTGAQLVIPGLEGIQGVLTTEIIPLGETLRSLSRRYGIPADALIRLNHLSSPAELYSGANMIVPAENSESRPAGRAALRPGETLLELAAVQGANPWSVANANQLEGTWEALPGDVLLVPGEGAEDGPGALPGEITSLELDPLPLVQGSTGTIRLESPAGLEVQGDLNGRELYFFEDGDGTYVALQGIHALAPPGLYPLTLSGRLEDGTPFGFTQMVAVRAGDFSFETLQVDPETIDPEVTRPEDEIWNALTEEASPERLWEGVFQVPVITAEPGCFSSLYGNRRSYNGSPYNYFHTGLDFCYNYNDEVNEIYAPAAGVVVYTGSLVVRGNATMIDHGWGVYSGYMQQSEIRVEVGERLEAGQVIGVAGKTGRVSGPHLHLEIWVGGVQVDPMEWLLREFP